MRALISVSDKEGVVEFAKGLEQLGFEILSTGGTHKLLLQNGVKARTSYCAKTASRRSRLASTRARPRCLRGGLKPYIQRFTAEFCISETTQIT